MYGNMDTASQRDFIRRLLLDRVKGMSEDDMRSLLAYLTGYMPEELEQVMRGWHVMRADVAANRRGSQTPPQ